MSVSSGAVAFPKSRTPIVRRWRFFTNTRSGSRRYSPNWSGARCHSRRFFIPDHFYEVGPQNLAFKVLFNRMSPSANSRQHGSGIFHTLAYLEHLQLQGVRVINGAKAFRYEISKAAQASLLKSLGLRFLPSRIIHSPHQAVAAAEGLRYPMIVKANTGGSGKGITRFNTKGNWLPRSRRDNWIWATTASRSCRNSFPRAAASSPAWRPWAASTSTPSRCT